MDFNLDKLLEAVSSAKDAIIGTSREVSEKPKINPEDMLQKPSPTFREYISQVEDAINAPRGLIYGMFVAENRGYDGKEFQDSPKGAVGFAQQTPIFMAELKRLGMEYDPNNPVLALHGMAFDLERNFKHFKDWDKAVAAYNTGRARMNKYKEVANANKETRDYVALTRHIVKNGAPPADKPTSKAFDAIMNTRVDKLMERY